MLRAMLCCTLARCARGAAGPPISIGQKMSNDLRSGARKRKGRPWAAIRISLGKREKIGAGKGIRTLDPNLGKVGTFVFRRNMPFPDIEISLLNQ